MPLRIESAQGRPGNGPADLSKTAGAEVCKDLTLNPDEGPAQTGTRPEFARPQSCANLVRTSKTRLRPQRRVGGQAFQMSSCPVRCA